MSDPADNPPRTEEPQAAYDPAVAGVQAAQQLKQSGFDRQQAEAVVVAVRELAGDLATKADLFITKSELRAEMSELKAELRAEMAELKAELRAEMAELKSELRIEMAELKSDLKTEMKAMETRLLKEISRSIFWAVGINIGVVGIAVAVLIAVMMRLLAAA